MDRFLLSITLVFHFIAAQGADKEVTLAFFVDGSSSMKSTVNKVLDVVPRITDRLEKSCGGYRVSVNPLIYTDDPRPNLEPIGDPPYITEETPQGPLLIKQRITNELIGQGMTYEVEGVQVQALDRSRPSSFSKETTFSSMADSLWHNRQDFVGQDVVATFLITDALPVYETHGPRQALQNIQVALDGVRYVSGLYAPRLSETKTLLEQVSSCDIDAQGFGDHFFTMSIEDTVKDSGWATHSFLGLMDFHHHTNQSQNTAGYFWDLCEQSPDQTLEAFVERVIIEAGCEPAMVEIHNPNIIDHLEPSA
ncbi:MAG: hypothetical protein AAF203_00645 [Pseudomonadota bacterium]